nr:hypothetical protein [Actinomycetota bacterium]
MKSKKTLALWMVALLTVMGLTLSACGQASTDPASGGQENGQPAGASENDDNPDDGDDADNRGDDDGTDQDNAGEDQD